MRHRMLAPLQLLVRGDPPAGPPEMGDMYFDSALGTIQVWDGERWGGLRGGGEDEVVIHPDDPALVEQDSSAELWVDTDEEGSAVDSGMFLPLDGGRLTGPLVIDPSDAMSSALIVESGGVIVNGGGIRLSMDQILGPDYAVTKEYCDANRGVGGVRAQQNLMFARTYGDGTADTFLVIHNLGTEDVVYALWDTATREHIEADVTILDRDTLRMNLEMPPRSGGVRVVVVTAADTADGQFLPLTGGTVDGDITVTGTVTAAAFVTTGGAAVASQGYVDEKFSEAMAAVEVTASAVKDAARAAAKARPAGGVPDPIEPTDPVNLRSLEQRFASRVVVSETEPVERFPGMIWLPL